MLCVRLESSEVLLSFFNFLWSTVSKIVFFIRIFDTILSKTKRKSKNPQKTQTGHTTQISAQILHRQRLLCMLVQHTKTWRWPTEVETICIKTNHDHCHNLYILRYLVFRLPHTLGYKEQPDDGLKWAETCSCEIFCTYEGGSKSFRPDQLFKVTETKQLCYFSI